MSNINERITFTEQRLTVLSQDLQTMQKELNEVLGEIQASITGLLKSVHFSVYSLNERITKLESSLSPEKVDLTDVPPTRDGVEL